MGFPGGSEVKASACNVGLPPGFDPCVWLLDIKGGERGMEEE